MCGLFASLSIDVLLDYMSLLTFSAIVSFSETQCFHPDYSLCKACIAWTFTCLLPRLFLVCSLCFPDVVNVDKIFQSSQAAV